MTCISTHIRVTMQFYVRACSCMFSEGGKVMEKREKGWGWWGERELKYWREGERERVREREREGKPL